MGDPPPANLRTRRLLKQTSVFTRLIFILLLGKRILKVCLIFQFSLAFLIFEIFYFDRDFDCLISKQINVSTQYF